MLASRRRGAQEIGPTEAAELRSEVVAATRILAQGLVEVVRQQRGR